MIIILITITIKCISGSTDFPERSHGVELKALSEHNRANLFKSLQSEASSWPQEV